MSQPKYRECKLFYVEKRDFDTEFIDKIQRSIKKVNRDGCSYFDIPLDLKICSALLSIKIIQLTIFNIGD
jgi:hypothetical protein